VTLVTGSRDPLHREKDVSQFMAMLRGRGQEVRRHEEEGGHNLPVDDAKAVAPYLVDPAP